MTKQTRTTLSVVTFISLLLAGLIVANVRARYNFIKAANEKMNLHAQMRTLEFEASMQEQLTLV